MHFLQIVLGMVEEENSDWMEPKGYWWIGLNDIEEEGRFVWPVGGEADFTWWYRDEPDSGEPWGDYDCTQMASMQYDMKWMTIECDYVDDITFAVCQLPLNG